MTKTGGRILTGAVAAGIVALLPPAALADGPQAIATAAQHAGIAAGQGDINAVHTHLHHVLNCLVGADGDGFDQSKGNPCANAGGAIPQTSDAAMKEKLAGLATEVRGAVMNQDVEAAKAVAANVQEMLSN